MLLGLRYYDPGQGRFLNRDPISYEGGINLYSYVTNGPLNGSDPSGLKNCLQAIADGDTGLRYDRCYQSDWNAGSRPGVAGAQQFVDHAIQMVPGGGLIYMFAGYDVWGCHLSPWQRILDGANGIANALGAMDAAAGMSGMGMAGGAAKAAQKEIALGLDPYYKDLAEQTGAVPWRDWVDKGIINQPASSRFGRMFHKAAQNADVIHFTLDGIDDFDEAVRLGARGFNAEENNVTNAELHYIVTHPDILDKTIFYWSGP